MSSNEWPIACVLVPCAPAVIALPPLPRLVADSGEKKWLLSKLNEKHGLFQGVSSLLGLSNENEIIQSNLCNRSGAVTLANHEAAFPWLIFYSRQHERLLVFSSD